MTTAISEVETPKRRVYDRYFKPVASASDSDAIQFDIEIGGTNLLPNISPSAQATVIDKLTEKTKTIEAPRYADSFTIKDSDILKKRAFGKQGVEMMKNVIRRNMKKLKKPHEATLEFNACNLLTQGKILDSDATTELFDYEIAADHKETLAGNDLWTDKTNSKPLLKMRAWKRKIAEDLPVTVTRWDAFIGASASDALQDHPDVKEILAHQEATRLVRDDDVDYVIKKINCMEYHEKYTPDSGTSAYLIPDDGFILIGVCDEWVDAQFAPILDTTVRGGIGNIAAGAGGKPTMVPYFAKPIRQENPGSYLVFAEQRQLVILKRPAAIFIATVI